MPKLVDRALSALMVEYAKPKTDTDGLLQIAEFPDTEANDQSGVKGLVLRVMPSGNKKWAFKYHLNGKRRKLTFADYPALSLKDARKRASDYQQEVMLGHDPLQEKIKAAHQSKDQPQTMAELCDSYLERHAKIKKREKSLYEDTRAIKKYIRPALGKKSLQDIKAYDIQSLHINLKKTPYQANRILSLLSKMFNLAVLWEVMTKNPAHGIEKYQEKKREKFLTREEITALSKALNEYPHQQPVNVIKMLLFTGARIGEVLSSRWQQFDFEQGTWVKKAAETKQNKEHIVQLNAPIISVLKSIDRISDYVFPGKTPDTHLTTIQRHWVIIRKKAGIEDTRIHDIRHTVASILASSGESLLVIGQILGHTQTQTTKRYSHLYDDPLKQASESLGDFIENAGKKADNIDK